MENKTGAISSAASNFQLVSNKLGVKTAPKNLRSEKTEDTISDSLETTDSDSQGAAMPNNSDDPGVDAASGRIPSQDGAEQSGTGTFLDISG